MDERDKDLTHLFVRDLDEIPLPPRGDWRRVKGGETTAMRASRYLLAAGAIAAVIAIALIIGFQLRDRNAVVAGPSASPKPSASGATVVTPRASSGSNAPTASPMYDDDFGFIVTDYGGFAADIRTESGTQRQGLQGLSFNSPGFAVSAYGKAVAYWTSSQPTQLRMFTVVGNATEQTLVTLAAGQRAGGLAWSSDGSALLYSTETGSFGVGGGTNSATLNVYELAGNGRHGTTIETQTNTGWLYRPVAWDRSTGVAAVGLTGDGGYMGFYLTVRFNPDNSVKIDRVDTVSRSMTMGSIRASTDAKLVLGVGGAGDITWWPIDNYGAVKTQAGAGKRGALWRPGTHEIGFIGPSDQFWLGDVDTAGSLGLCCTSFSGAPATSTLRTFRADGIAVVLAVVPPGGTGLTDYTLVRLGSDPKSTSGDRVTFQDIRDVAASIRLR
jgi:hypothetical protein